MPLLAEGEFALMQDHLSAALQHDLAMGAAYGSDHEVYAMLADAAAQQRDLAGLQTYASLAQESAARVDHKLYLGIAHRARGVAHTLADEYAQARTELQLALDLFRGYPAPWQIGRTLYELGHVAQRERKTDEARRHFTEALQAFEALEAAPYAERTRAALDTLDRG